MDEDVKIINTFDKLYELLKPEFNSGLITVVGSVLNHITGLKLKTDNTGDVDLLLNSREAEIRLIEVSPELSKNVIVSYEPNSKFRSVTIRYDGEIIETFRIDPKKGELIDIEYKSKIYKMYKQNMGDQLNEILNIIIILCGRVKSGIIIYKNEPTHPKYHKIRQNLMRLEKQFKNTEMHMNKADFDYTLLTHYKTYVIVRDDYKTNHDLFYDETVIKSLKNCINK